MRKQGGKLIIFCFIEGEKHPTLSNENGDKSQMLIKDKDKVSNQKLKHNIHN